jgi:methylglutaconyl-CoA hydratase
MAMTYETLTVDINDKIATVTLNRPDVRNAFNEHSINDLARAFSELGRNENVRAIVLAGNGPALCAGGDLNWMKKMAHYTHEENEADAMQLAQMLRTIYLCPKPTVARVHGDCYAGGMGLVSACDIIVAVPEANFCLSEVKLGLIKAMGEQASRRYFLTAERFSAAEAHRIGMVHELVPADALDAKMAEVLKALVTNSPNAVKEAKVLVRDIAGKPVNDALLADTAQRIAHIRASEQGREGVTSFLEKRKPGWLN